MALAVLLPAAFAAGAVLLLTRHDEASALPHPQPPGKLARLADLRGTRPAPAPSSPALLPRPKAQTGRLQPLAGGIRPAPPARVSIPGAGVEARVLPVSVSAGALEVPDVGTAGWYEGGPRPGEPGRAVVIGHLDTREGAGLFARVPGLRRGAIVAVEDRRGSVHRYRVVGGAQVPKYSFPVEHVYGPSRRPVLVLVTCGGPYEPGRGYRDNVLVYARAA